MGDEHIERFFKGLFTLIIVVLVAGAWKFVPFAVTFIGIAYGLGWLVELVGRLYRRWKNRI